MSTLSIRSKIQVEIRELLKLVIPLASAQIAQAGAGFVDSVMMSWLGQEILASGALATITFNLFMFTGIGVVSSVSSLVAEAYGAQRNRQVGQITRQGLWIALLLALPGMLIIANLDTVMRQFGQAETTVALADTYLNIVAWGLFPAIGFAVLRGCIVALSEARPIMFIVIIATLFNAVGNYALAFGKLGFPVMGIAGLAIATMIAHWIMFLWLFGYMLWNKRLRVYSLFQSLHHLEPRITKQLLGVGVPVGIVVVLEYVLYTTVTFMMGALGVPVLAAHQVVWQTIIVVFMVPLATSYAVTVRVGQWLGKQNWSRVWLAVFVSIGLAVTFMLVTGIFLLIFSRQIISLYLNLDDPVNAEAISVAVSILSIAALGQILDAVQRTLYGALIGLQDTGVPMLLGATSYLGVGLTTSHLLGFQQGLGGMGVWIGFYAGLAAAAIVFFWRFWRIMSRNALYVK